MNKNTLIIFTLFICGCTPQLLPPLTTQPTVSGNNQSNISASPVISTSVSPMPIVSQTPNVISSSPSASGSNNSDPGFSSIIDSSSNPITTVKINVPVNYANSYLYSQTKSVEVIITDDTGKISTISLSSSGGDIVIPVNTKTLTFNALDSSNKLVSTISQNVNFSSNTNNDIVLQVNFSKPVNVSNSSRGGFPSNF